MGESQQMLTNSLVELFGEPSLSTNYNQCPPHTICLGVGEDINHWFWGRGSGD